MTDPTPPPQSDLFRRFSTRIAKATGTPTAFIIALSIIFLWAISGPLFNFSNTWQLMINTFTTLITFIMVFLIQNSQNRDTKAIHLKLDELLRSQKSAHNQMIDIENSTDQEIASLEAEFKRLHDKAKKILAKHDHKSI